MSKRSVARGALLGAFIGDASGATLEFLDRKPSAEDVERALSMVGGGCWRVAPGQITDDGELALCLARSLAGAQAVDRDKVAEAYVDWFNSGPFDCGNATNRRMAVIAVRIRPLPIIQPRMYAPIIYGLPFLRCGRAKLDHISMS
jgi:ADP-ribosyl-[dinitrogen reductase] hydrolase